MGYKCRRGILIIMGSGKAINVSQKCINTTALVLLVMTVVTFGALRVNFTHAADRLELVNTIKAQNGTIREMGEKINLLEGSFEAVEEQFNNIKEQSGGR